MKRRKEKRDLGKLIKVLKFMAVIMSVNLMVRVIWVIFQMVMKLNG